MSFSGFLTQAAPKELQMTRPLAEFERRSGDNKSSVTFLDNTQARLGWNNKRLRVVGRLKDKLGTGLMRRRLGTERTTLGGATEETSEETSDIGSDSDNTTGTGRTAGSRWALWDFFCA